MAIVYGSISGQEPSTVTFKVRTVTVPQNSSNMQQELLTLADPESSLGVARVVAAAPDSTHYGVVVRQVGYTAPSTTVQVSSLGGVVSVLPAAGASVRVEQSTAADLQATVTPASTVWAVQAAQAGNWTVRANVSSTAADNPVSAAQSGSWTVSVSGYSTTANVSSLAGRVAIAGFHATDGITNVTDSTNTAIRVNVVAGSAAGSTITTVSQLLDSSGGSVTAADSANNAIRVNVVAGAAAGSTIVTVSTGSVRVHQSTAADLQATVAQASTVWAVQLSNYSTTAQVSSVGGVVSVAQNSTVWVTQARLLDGASNALESSTSAPSSGARGLVIRPVLGGLDTFSNSTTGQSSATTILSSAATSRGYIYAISVISTLGGPVAWGIYAGATRKWGGVLAAVSSAVSGAVIAVSPPAYLCAGSTGEPLTFNCESSNRGLNVSLGYWQST
jgi:hypothetical protein